MCMYAVTCDLAWVDQKCRVCFDRAVSRMTQQYMAVWYKDQSSLNFTTRACIAKSVIKSLF